MSSKAERIVSIALLSIVLAFIYNSWFSTNNIITGGDWGYIYREQFKSFSIFPQAWESVFNLGYSNIYFIWTTIFQNIYISLFGDIFDFSLITRIGFCALFILISAYSSYLLSGYFFRDKYFLRYCSALIYTANTYIIMVLDGGQFLIALSYAIAPFMYYIFIKTTHLNIHIVIKGFIVGMMFSLQILFDPRIAFVTFIGLCILWSLYITDKLIYISSWIDRLRALIISIVTYFLIPLCVVLLLHAFWIYPSILTQENPIDSLGVEYSSAEALKFFSFAKLENSISLLHPNWPENIFGKTFYMKAEFLVMTVLAWVGVLFLIMKNRAGNSERNVFVLLYAFVIVGCFGIFLSKGINDPLGRVYVFLFEKVPGFRLFRDPTKFYALSAIAFSLLIPFGIEQISKYVTSKRIIYARIQTNYLYYGLVSLFTVYLLFLIHPVYLRNLSGTLGIKSLPEEYVKLKNFIVSDSSFSRILFIPQIHRLSFYSQEHPAVSYGYLFNTATAEQALASLYNQKSDEFKKILQERSIKYVVVPYDVYQEMFVSDGVYDITLRNKLLDRLNQMPWLTKNTDFKNITVYKVDDPKEKFWNVPLKAIGEASIHYKNITPSQYQINVNFQGENQLLIFSEGFHHSWRLLSTDYIVYSKPYNGLNSFKINKSGKYVIEFEPQKYVTDGAILSLITLCVMGIVVGIYVYKLRSIFIDNR